MSAGIPARPASRDDRALLAPGRSDVRCPDGQVKPVRRPGTSDVSDKLAPRAAELSADIYDLIVREIPQLRSDKRVMPLLESSVAENVATLLIRVTAPPGE